jgi:AcrR family transcriptional regulator
MGEARRERRSVAADEIVGVVVDLLETGGYDAVQLRVVAQRARVSLATIYRRFATRDELIVTAIERWMATHCYTDVAQPPPGETVYEGLMRVLRYVYEPWERSPRILEAYHRARIGPSGRRLDRQGMAAIAPAAQAVLADADPAYVADLGLVLRHVSYAVIGRFADGTIDITEVLPTLERAVRLATANNERLAIAAGERQAMQD